MIYQALSVIEPVGEWIRSGKKTIEVRDWIPDIALPLHNLLIVQNKHRLSSKGMSYDPNGNIVALVDVKNIRKWEEADLGASCSKRWEEGWFAWELQNIRPVIYALNVPAKLRIYEIEIDRKLLEK